MTDAAENDGIAGFDVGNAPLGYTEQPPLDMEALNRAMAAYSHLPPLEPLKLTTEQWDEVQALLGPPVPGPALFNSVPVYIVDRVEDSTPYLRRMEKLRAAAEQAMQVPFPNVFDFQVRGIDA